MPYVWKTEVVEVEPEVSSLDFPFFFDFFEIYDVAAAAARKIRVKTCFRNLGNLAKIKSGGVVEF